ncbi:MAG: hypothetical protein M3Z04_09920, partial [Chloroflexota bacterium]|nr:hypothetical protein [Chloroflexota bacterium]
MYLVWYDNSKKTTQEKIDEAVDRFQDRFGFAPDHCLVNVSSLIEHPHLDVRGVRYVRPDYFQVGCEDETMARALVARATVPTAALVPLDLAGGAGQAPHRMMSATAMAALAPRKPLVKRPRKGTPIAEAPVAEALVLPVAVPVAPMPVAEVAPAASRAKRAAKPPAPVADIAPPVIELAPLAATAPAAPRAKRAAKPAEERVVAETAAPVAEVAPPAPRAKKTAKAGVAAVAVAAPT